MEKSVLQKQSVGIDVSKDDFVVRLFHRHSSGRLLRRNKKKFTQNAKGFAHFQGWLDKFIVADVTAVMVLEATGVYHESLAHFLHRHDYSVSIVLPNKVKAYAKSFNEKSKTDELDADLLARMGAERELDLWQPAHPHLRQIKALVRQRQVFVQERTMMTNRRHAIQHSEDAWPQVMERYQLLIDQLEEQIQQLEKQIDELRKADESLNEQVQLLTSIPGVGVVSAVNVLAESGAMQLFDNREQIVSYAGLDVVTHQSGSSVHKKSRISKKGNTRLRTALYMPAVSLVRSKGPFKNLYDRVLKRTGVPKKALVAVQRKLLVVMYALIKKQEHYQLEKHQQHLKIQVGESKPAYTDSVGSRQPVFSW